MQAGDVKLGAIFFDNHRYEIPMFQRPYVWSENRNWAPLWEDIAAIADGVVADMESGDWPEEPPTYFLGSVVVKTAPNHPQRLSGSILIDGQQRLTTVQVILAAARSVAFQLGADSAMGRFDDWVMNNPKTVHDKWPDDRYKLWPLPQDRPEYLWAVRAAEDTRTSPEPEHRISQARVWFENKIHEWALQGDNPSDRLDALHSALETRVELVRITLEKTDNAQIIFEALNHRGVELSQSDLIKNLLFRLVEEQGQRKDAESLLVHHWLPLDGRYWRQETTSGRIKRSLLDQLVSYWLTLRVKDVVSVERLFDDFKQWMSDEDFNAAEVIKEIRFYADLYDDLVNNPPDEPTAALIDLVTVTKTNTAWPLILSVYGNNNISVAERQKTARALYSYLTRRMICGLTTKDYNRLFTAVLNAASTRATLDGRVGDEVQKTLAGFHGETRNWPDDTEFTASFFSSNFYALTKARQRAFFAGLENHLRDDRAEDQSPIRATFGYLNIEHIMPQKWQTHWPIPNENLNNTPNDAADLQEAVEHRDQAINLVGNLTLTNGRLNSQMRHAAWPVKKDALQQKSTLLITTASILSPPPTANPATVSNWSETWDETRIKKRTKYLADLALEVWPRPDYYPAINFDSIDQDELYEDTDNDEQEEDF